MHKAIALYSSGLDSFLAILVVKKQKIEIIAIKFLTGFEKPVKEWEIHLSQKIGFELKEIDIREKFLDIVKNPKYGYGKNLNPCIDCKILMLKEAKKRMQEYGASFIITGEVLGQRPMSQRKEIFSLMEKETSLHGLILRPLSAKLLPPTEPEIQKVVDRSLLYDIWGRTRKPQLALAKEFGIEKIPQPAGGCLLTDPFFCRKVKDLIEHDELNVKNTKLLRIGRHFRISHDCKAIAGRNEIENKILLNNYDGIFLYPSDFKGPVVVLLGLCTERELQIAAALCVHYSKRKKSEIVIKEGETEQIKTFNVITEKEIVKYRI
uniref:tRNA 4-thiouridine(8) synthase ThiI n=1 Tax=Thermodesulfovibrio aggregans TaxID=86166 RepID=A0A7C4AK50_9BACT